MKSSRAKLTRPMLIVAIGVAALLGRSTVSAHHSFAAEFDSNNPIKLKGKITQMEWVNPHSWLHVDVRGADGKVVNWTLEFGSPNQLYRQGWRTGDLPVGSEVSIEGYRSKDGSSTGAASNVILTNGKKLFAGSPGTGAPTEPKQ